MKLKRYLQLAYVKSTFSILFWEFHRIVCVGLLALICCAGIITIGPALCAMCACMRQIADDETIRIGSFFSHFKRLFRRGLILSLLIILAAGSIYASLLLLNNAQGLTRASCYTALVLVIAGVYFLCYYPFAASSFPTVSAALLASFVYAATRITDTVFILSLNVIFFFIAVQLKSVGVMLFLPFCAYFAARVIHANNIEIDDREQQSPS